MAKDMRRIGEMRNLGPMVEADFLAIGVKYAYQLKDLGVEKAFLQMLEGRVKNNKPVRSINAIYLYALHGAIHNLDWRAIPDKQKRAYKKMTHVLRNSGLY
ncbi:MAG: TfoX/Sxy family DNA transformation protein [Deltaproteobacteria bacterium]|nr:TfoX/Sxy family DNA transformation protein [Deltaproteobacteria bacterium]